MNIKSKDWRNIVRGISLITFLALFYLAMTGMPHSMQLVAGTPVTIAVVLGIMNAVTFGIFHKKKI